ncbi:MULTISPECIES: nuclear transport factor 2 family protein [Cryobacterium]|uniref:Ketosteroid isomerase n=1 Tax=Cryobacterium zongtaii TaxID=1259217 RepID=A0A2S3Z6Y0_9MICO|nr:MULTISPECIES: nuclear transport factor 2 family protein [Cryobacterium]POH61343.1 ketosteroid isomerase [Cryobacterium zongtaii]POH64626.1 ketosteroid isomerase [Cryobacterium zongtaii]TFC46271.1 nuclear transport factor 2 family protein [Cryobacterium sp. TMN-39-2]
MTEPIPAAVAETYFAALGRGDIPTVMAQFSDDVLWHQPGAHQFSGDHHGVAGVGALLSGMMEASAGSFQLAVAGPPMVNGDVVAVPVRFSGNSAEATMDMAGIDLLTVRGGKIVEVRLFSEDGPAEDAFWGLN